MANSVSEVGAYAEGNLAISGRFAAGRDQHIYQGPSAARPDYRLEIRALVEFYTEVFVGREAEIGRCLRFTAGAKPGYLLIEAPPAFGKSALAAQLVARAERGDWAGQGVPDLVAFFIREEGQRDSPAAFLTAVNAQLLDLLEISGGVPADVDAARNQFSWLWSQAVAGCHAERPLLLLVDGLDEMAAGRLTIAQLLPTGLDRFVHVIVTSRPNPEPLKSVGPEHPLRKARVERLQRFGLADIESLLGGGETAAALAPRVLATTRGEPLLARFVCEDVVADGEAALVGVEEHPPEGVREYFEWQVSQLAARAEADLAREALAVLLLSRGPISVAELAGILRRPPRAVASGLAPVWRFLVGEDRLELMHLELRAVLASDFSDDEVEQARARILAWSGDYRDRGWPADTPLYVLEHYADHLADLDDEDTLAALLDQDWMRLKFERIGSHTSFARDLRTAVDLAARRQATVSTVELRWWFMLACLASAATDVSVGALAVMAELGSIERAESYARLAPPDKQGPALAEIAVALLRAGDQHRGDAMLEEAIGAARLGVDAESRSEEMAGIAVALIGGGLVGRTVELLRASADLPAEFTYLFAYLFARSGERDAALWCLDHAAEGRSLVEDVDDVFEEIEDFAATAEALCGRGAEGVARAAAIPDEADRLTALVHLLALDLEDGQARAAAEAFDAAAQNQASGGSAAGLWLLGRRDEARAVLQPDDEDEASRRIRAAAEILALSGRTADALALMAVCGVPAAARADAVLEAASDLAELRLLRLAADCAAAAFVEGGPDAANLHPRRIGDLALALARAGDTRPARDLCERALAASLAISAYEMSRLDGDLAAAIAAAGDARTAVRHVTETGRYGAERAIGQVVVELVRDGHLDAAVSVAGLAEPSREIVEALVGIGRIDVAAEIVDRRAGHWDYQRLRATLAVAEALSGIRDPSEETRLRDALEAALARAAAGDLEELVVLAYAAAVRGRDGLAEGAMARVYELMSGTDEVYITSVVRARIAMTAAVLGDRRVAARRLDEVPSWARREAVQGMVAGLARVGRLDDAADVLRNFKGWQRGDVVQHVVVGLAQSGRHVDAVRLLDRQDEAVERLEPLAAVVETLSAVGALDDALALLDTIGADTVKLPRLHVTARRRAERGDVAGARELAGGLLHDEARVPALLAVEVAAGDPDSSRVRAGLAAAARNGRRAFLRALRAAPPTFCRDDVTTEQRLQRLAEVLEWWRARDDDSP